MRNFITFIFFSISTTFFAQQYDYYTKNGFAADGFDVVSYFVSKKPSEGKNEYQTVHNGTKFKFSSAKNLALFIKDPEAYIPQYGGYCAYAVAEKKIKMYVDPEAYEIRDGKLYLFYSSWLSDKLKTWQEEDTKKLQQKGDKNWADIKYKSE
ncbi:YHS domain-containing (seleno)protein [Tenacibaculum maritimum]|uniref:YHS domain-containing protein n=2 Tax=Tenacibaculum maritimum TaxID=107401 RepID=A0A2H1EDQ9_9FLAO|nr:YHS domain-containing (seleno)protein [Tenacibaculum maritimum]MCD9562373.1 YHS domain-containing protein [Tenacibaculum maritimum]MCD9565726.1 YHS domain-containing protein [Tenacibaculum maritimum]MCD9579355.1 YHS domain-containing protein [Tenacibaculum maritimum]MCD9580753.1 YHS domain-containing protein [Tenacibaculum maritimum]MCD9596271.1 YHS domain-containing protein [Tenacibaculum maritimum]